ncbi:hypothetical protein ACA910_021569 [Epithemia clementina (nom. ined.)]
MKYASDDAFTWHPDGKSFVIVNDDIFVQKVLSKDFKASKYSSFVRKLHRWGFVRLTSGTGKDCFHHPQFQKDRYDLAGEITSAPNTKVPAKRTKRRRRSDTSTEGDEMDPAPVDQKHGRKQRNMEISEPDPFPPDTEDLGSIDDDVWDSDG